MKFLLLILITIFILRPAKGQSYEKHFEIAGEKIFKVSIEQNKIITLKATLGTGDDAAKDSILLTNLDKTAFLFHVENQIILLTDSDFVKNNKAEMDSTLQDIYNGFFPVSKSTQKAIADSVAKVAAEDSIIYGRDEYYGLTDIQKDSLTNALKAIRQMQEKRFNFRKDSAHIGFLFFYKFKHKSDSLKNDSMYKAIKSLDRKIRALKDFRKFQVYLIGNANVVSSFKVAQQTQLNGGVGIIVSKPNHSEFVGVFTISQSTDTIVSIGKTSSDFGTSMLVPGVRKFSLLTSFRQRQLWPTSYSNFWRKIGIALNINITPYNWAIRKADNSADSAGLSAKPIPASMDLMFPFTWVNVYQVDQEISISTDLGVTCRYLMGDINAEQRKQFLGKSDNFYGGLIGGINIRYNGLRIQFHVPLLFGSHVDGLTGGQAYASMSFVAKIVGPNSFQSLFK